DPVVELPAVGMPGFCPETLSAVNARELTTVFPLVLSVSFVAVRLGKLAERQPRSTCRCNARTERPTDPVSHDYAGSRSTSRLKQSANHATNNGPTAAACCASRQSTLRPRDAQPERIGIGDRVIRRIRVQVEPAREPDRVFLREAARPPVV